MSEDRRSYLSEISLSVEVGHDQAPDRLEALMVDDLTGALTDRGCIVWGWTSGWRDPSIPSEPKGPAGLWVAPAEWVGRLDGRAEWRPATRRRAHPGPRLAE